MVLGVSVVCRAEIPKLLTERAFTPASLAQAVNHYVHLGEQGTFKELDAFLVTDATNTNWRFDRGYSVDERIGWIFRILYTPKPGIPMVVAKTGAIIPGVSVPLRPPQFGTLTLPEKTMPQENWPLYPVALSGSTYIVLKEKYLPKDHPEDIKHYMAYCQENGLFRNIPILVPTREQAMKDTAALRQSPSWKVIKWIDKSGPSFPYGEQWTYATIHSQAGAIPVPSIAVKHPVSNPANLSLR